MNDLYISNDELSSCKRLGNGLEGSIYLVGDNSTLEIFNIDENFDSEEIARRIDYFSNIKIDGVEFPLAKVYNEEKK